MNAANSQDMNCGRLFRRRCFSRGAGRRLAGVLVLTGVVLLICIPQISGAASLPIPSFQIGVGQAEGPEDVAVVLQVIALLTVLSLAPAIMILMTSFTRIIIVFHFLRQAMGAQQSPPNQVIIGLALFMTFFIIKPVASDVYDNALNPYMERQLSFDAAFEQAQKPIRNFLLLNPRENDLALFVKGADIKKPKTT